MYYVLALSLLSSSGLPDYTQEVQQPKQVRQFNWEEFGRLESASEKGQYMSVADKWLYATLMALYDRLTQQFDVSHAPSTSKKLPIHKIPAVPGIRTAGTGCSINAAARDIQKIEADLKTRMKSLDAKVSGSIFSILADAEYRAAESKVLDLSASGLGYKIINEFLGTFPPELALQILELDLTECQLLFEPNIARFLNLQKVNLSSNGMTIYPKTTHRHLGRHQTTTTLILTGNPIATTPENLSPSVEVQY
ncbi:MAG: hypothetical protein V4534_02655 [Myxococcota bacterium]